MVTTFIIFITSNKRGCIVMEVGFAVAPCKRDPTKLVSVSLPGLCLFSLPLRTKTFPSVEGSLFC